MVCLLFIDMFGWVNFFAAAGSCFILSFVLFVVGEYVILIDGVSHIRRFSNERRSTSR